MIGIVITVVIGLTLVAITWLIVRAVTGAGVEYEVDRRMHNLEGRFDTIANEWARWKEGKDVQPDPRRDPRR